jgi:hypothetical protein
VVVQESKKPIDPGDIVVSAGYEIESVASGISYPVDVTFDDQGNTYIVEADGHTYGTKPPKAPEARILKILPDGSIQVLYDKVVPNIATAISGLLLLPRKWTRGVMEVVAAHPFFIPSFLCGYFVSPRLTLSKVRCSDKKGLENLLLQ